MGDKMKTNKDILSSVLKTAQMGQTGIRAVEKYAEDPELRQALDSQLREYNSIEQAAYGIAAHRGWVLPELGIGAKAMSHMMSRMQLMGKDPDSKIAALMVNGNTRGVIKGLKNDHRYENRDGRIEALSRRLLDKEYENIKQMEQFL
jgi:hypothetical protein